MKGDKLVIHEGHITAARGIVAIVLPEIINRKDRFIMTIAGESGSGKSEIASVVSDLLAGRKIKSIILQQDDYFVYPPKTNARMRREDIRHVGLSEVRLELLDRNLKAIIDGKDSIEKPLVIFEEDRIDRESINLNEIKTVITEGTYTTILKNVHRRIFIDRTYIDTRQTRLARAREKQDEFLEEILRIEHEIISSHRPLADIIVTKDYQVTQTK